MRAIFYCIGILASIGGIGLAVATAMSKSAPLTGYSAALFVFLGGVVCLFAGAKNYRGHWAFVTGIILCTLALASLGGLIDDYTSTKAEGELGFAIFLIAAFLTFGILSLWSGHRLHKCMVELERNRKEHAV
jgi:peptidoglycan/LPS O-acetylase OafA/YrhL